MKGLYLFYGSTYSNISVSESYIMKKENIFIRIKFY